MSKFELYAVTDEGPQALVVPDSAETFADLYAGLSLGVYSALRTFDHNKFLGLADHMARTQRSMSMLGWAYDWDTDRFRRTLHELATQFSAENARIRFDILPDSAETLGTSSRELIALQPLIPVPASAYETGVVVDVATGIHRLNPQIKTADFAAIRQQMASDPDVYELLMLDMTDHILEGTTTNFWGVRNGVVWTAGEGVLEGVTRKILLKLIDELGIPLRLEPVNLSEVPLLDEAAISSSSRALLPVVRIGQQAIGDGQPGPICRQLLAAYNAFLAREICTAVTSCD